MIPLLVGFATALAAALVAMFIAAAVAAPRGMPVADVLRVYPDLARLLVNLSRDRRVARSVRWRLLVALAYNAQPINLIPDFIPVIGLADNVVITGWAVRSAIRRSGPDVVLSNWRGGEARFALLCRLCRLTVLPASHPGEEPEPDRQATGRILTITSSEPSSPPMHEIRTATFDMQMVGRQVDRNTRRRRAGRARRRGVVRDVRP